MGSMGIQRKKEPSVEMRRRHSSGVLRSEPRFVHAVRREHVQGRDPDKALVAQTRRSSAGLDGRAGGQH